MSKLKMMSTLIAVSACVLFPACAVEHAAEPSPDPRLPEDDAEYDAESIAPNRNFWKCSRAGNVMTCEVRKPTKDTKLERFTVTWNPDTLTAVAHLKEKGKANRVVSRVRLPNSPITHLPIGSVPGLEISQGVLVGNIYFGPSGGGFVGQSSGGWSANVDIRPTPSGQLVYRTTVRHARFPVPTPQTWRYNGSLANPLACAAAVTSGLAATAAIVAALPAITGAAIGATAVTTTSLSIASGALWLASELLSGSAAACGLAPGPGDYCAIFERQIHSQRKSGALADYRTERFVLAFRGAARMPMLADGGFGISYGCGFGDLASGCAAESHERSAYPSRVPLAGLRNEETSYRGYPLRRGTDQMRTIGGRQFYPYETVFTDGTNYWVAPVNFGVGHSVQDVDWQAAFDPNPLVRSTLHVVAADDWLATVPNWRQQGAFFSCQYTPANFSHLPVYETGRR
jgi:hypothetical protein